MNRKIKDHIGVVVNNTKKGTESVVSEIKKISESYNKKVIIIDYDIREKSNREKASISLKSAFLIISIGGDGTLLSALKIAIKYDIPVLPIYYGTLGFIAEIVPKDAILILKDFLSSKNELHTIEKRLVLSIKVDYHQSTCEHYHAINEIVVSKPEGRPIHLDATILGRPISRLVGDGVVIATPTGSTAYALSAGGPIVSPSLRALSFVPIAPHSLTFRPIIIPDKDNIEIKLNKKSSIANITIDGDHISKINNLDNIYITAAKKSCLIFQNNNRKFYDTLLDKLNWGI